MPFIMPLVTNAQITALRRNDPQTIAGVRGLLTDANSIMVFMRDLDGTLGLLTSFLDNIRVVAEIYKEADDLLKKLIIEYFLETDYIKKLQEPAFFNKEEQFIKLLKHDSFFILFTDDARLFQKILDLSRGHFSLLKIYHLFTRDFTFLEEKLALVREQVKKNLCLLEQLVVHADKLPAELYPEMKQVLLALLKTYVTKNEYNYFSNAYRIILRKVKLANKNEYITPNELLGIAPIGFIVRFFNESADHITKVFTPEDYKQVMAAFAEQQYAGLNSAALQHLIRADISVLVSVIQCHPLVMAESESDSLVWVRLIIGYFSQRSIELMTLSPADKIVVFNKMVEYIFFGEKQPSFDNVFFSVREAVSQFMQSLIATADLQQLSDTALLFLYQRKEPVFIAKVDADPDLKARKDQLVAVHLSQVMTVQLQGQVEASLEEIRRLKQEIERLREENALLQQDSRRAPFTKWGSGSPFAEEMKREDSEDVAAATELSVLGNA